MGRSMATVAAALAELEAAGIAIYADQKRWTPLRRTAERCCRWPRCSRCWSAASRSLLEPANALHKAPIPCVSSSRASNVRAAPVFRPTAGPARLTSTSIFAIAPHRRRVEMCEDQARLRCPRQGKVDDLWVPRISEPDALHLKRASPRFIEMLGEVILAVREKYSLIPKLIDPRSSRLAWTCSPASPIIPPPALMNVAAPKRGP
jgi:hypothetical protein